MKVLLYESCIAVKVSFSICELPKDRNAYYSWIRDLSFMDFTKIESDKRIIFLKVVFLKVKS
jgi:hypothetical protein